MALIVGSKGQIVISKEIRDKLGVKPGWIALERLTGDHIEVYFIPPEHEESLKASLLPYIKTHISSDKEWDKARNTAWDEAVEKKIIRRKKAS
ncbi:MAG: AbrB/MazE/SpoVT family DNA-binding domain-containing protein [Actinobacteria bacterium]|nr:AbrB/MazE/SpoVT family DNA-binding domain-containing protein [Actinomycetota bacterium]